MKKMTFLATGMLAMVLTAPVVMADEAESEPRKEQYMEQHQEQQQQLKEQRKAMHKERKQIHEGEMEQYRNRLKEKQDHGFRMNGGNGRK